MGRKHIAKGAMSRLGVSLRDDLSSMVHLFLQHHVHGQQCGIRLLNSEEPKPE